MTAQDETEIILNMPECKRGATTHIPEGCRDMVESHDKTLRFISTSVQSNSLHIRDMRKDVHWIVLVGSGAIVLMSSLLVAILGLLLSAGPSGANTTSHESITLEP